MPDAKTVWLFREQLTRAGPASNACSTSTPCCADAGYLAMGGQIVDATVVQARRPRLSQGEKAIVKGGAVPEGYVEGEAGADGYRRPLDLKLWPQAVDGPGEMHERSRSELVIPVFGYKNHLSIDRHFGFIRTFAVLCTAAHDGRPAQRNADGKKTCVFYPRSVWADMAPTVTANLALLTRRGHSAAVPEAEAARQADAAHLARGNAARARSRSRSSTSSPSRKASSLW